MVLIDGSVLTGTLQVLNPSHIESQDRDLALKDVEYTSNEGIKPDYSEGTTIVSATQIRFWNIVHEPLAAD